MTQATLTRSRTSFAVTTLLAAGLLTSACATKAPTIPSWGGTTPPVSYSASNVAQPVPLQPVALHQTPDAGVGSSGRATFTQGCSGNYTQRDARTGRTIAHGRAYNSGTGIIGLDARGRRAGILASNATISLLFLPDCNCRPTGNQSSAFPATHQLATTAPSSASCSAG